ncbi:uncharacterized protein si:zfos-741a10.3 [Danio aesculapii]|uniref:uncharacterized protein si:zfos-741a10.3 n=1 Tax=Danio aesculapii TaxID=1142201 RepID=UPI0024C01F07|nr:uncharacterized protein si:zfos-741a10.3 [Danio aesculapii]
MRLVCGLIMMMVMMVHTAAGEERFCRFNQSGPCNPSLGDKLCLQLVPNTRVYDLKIEKITTNNTQVDPVCRITNDIIKNKYECDLYNNRPEVSVINGTLIINSVSTADSGFYRLFVYNSEGSQTSTADLQVNVKDPFLTAKVLGSLAVILIVLLSVLYFFYRKKKKAKPSSDVDTTVDPQKKPGIQKKNEDIHYGEINFSKSHTRHTHQTQNNQEECLYAQVQTS